MMCNFSKSALYSTFFLMYGLSQQLAVDGWTECLTKQANRPARVYPVGRTTDFNRTVVTLTKI